MPLTAEQRQNRSAFLLNIDTGLSMVFVALGFIAEWDPNSWPDLSADKLRRVTNLVALYRVNVESLATTETPTPALVEQSKEYLREIRVLLRAEQPEN